MLSDRRRVTAFVTALGIVLISATTDVRGSPLTPHAYAQQSTDLLCSTSTLNYGGYFDSSNTADDLSGGSTNGFITKEMWVVMADSCGGKWIELGSVDGALSGGYWNGAYWARENPALTYDYYEEAIQPEYLSGEHSFEIQWTGSAWQVVVDFTVKRSVTDEGSSSAQQVAVGIEASDSATTFRSGTFMSCLEYLAPDNTQSWYYWPTAYNGDSNNLGWSSSYTSSGASSSCANRVTFTHS
jgi:hypothetical protein